MRQKLWKLISGTRAASWWLRRKSRLLERSYVERLASLSQATAQNEGAAPLTARRLPRRILFIGDCMWEPGELIPELRKIAPADMLDLRPCLNEEGSLSPGERVARAVEAFSKNERADYDVILVYARSALLSDAVFSRLRARWTCPLLGMNLDDRVQFFPYGVYREGNDGYGEWAPQFDLNLTSCRPALEWYRQAGANAVYLPMGFHPSAKPDSPAAGAPRRGLTFVGSWKPERGALISRLQRAGVDLTLFGGGWPEAGWAADPHEIYRGSQLNLGIGLSTATGGISSLKARDLECPGAGGCYLTTYQWELADLYDIGREILCYRNFEELLEMARWHLARPDLCAQIARAGQRRALAEHTWERRFRSLFAEE